MYKTIKNMSITNAYSYLNNQRKFYASSECTISRVMIMSEMVLVTNRICDMMESNKSYE